MKRGAFVLAALVALAGCGKDAPEPAANAGNTAHGMAAAPAAPSPPLAKRTGALTNPEDTAMVMLYHDLAGLPAPISRWVEADSRLQFTPGAQKAAMREQITREFESARDAVRSVGILRITLADAQLSDYDPGYGEYTLRALSPSSTIIYKTLGTEVTLKFDNARVAQLWRVPPDEARRVADTLGTYGRAALDLTLAVTGVIPGTAGGTLTTRIVEY
jgi:hypothetical protein